MTIDRRMLEMQQIRDEISAMHKEVISYQGDGGSGGNGTRDGMSDDWKTSVNTQLEQLHGDVRNLLYGWIGAVVLVLTALSVGYIKLADQSADIKTEQAKQGVRLDNIDKKLDEISAKLDRQK